MSRAVLAPALILALVSGAAGQSLQDQLLKAPPEIDQRLRERVREFYQLHVDRRYRQAERLVAEDTKDFFFEQKKAEILKFEIKDILYSDEFTKAKVTVVCERVVMMPGFAGKPIGVPVPSYWKIEGNDWFWYVDQSKLAETPFGVMKRPQAGAQSGNVDLASAMNSAPTVASLQEGVQADKDKVVLGPGREKAEVAIANLLPGKVQLTLEVPPVKGLKVTLAKSELSGRERTALAIEATEPLATPALIRVNAAPVGKVLYVLVSYDKPAK